MNVHYKEVHLLTVFHVYNKFKFDIYFIHFFKAILMEIHANAYKVNVLKSTKFILLILIDY